eukprot:TRINITY_DN33314_c0_g1_i1.p1 TRINITY_DN33314_c0_g1~~TRINITY_DN33314_c0_g1_i1.p1  ORF type:complete len:110 (-),score=6.02 TRINITY_DN33314_c0_g1_i1:211-540(-)
MLAQQGTWAATLTEYVNTNSSALIAQTKTAKHTDKRTQAFQVKKRQAHSLATVVRGSNSSSRICNCAQRKDLLSHDNSDILHPSHALTGIALSSLPHSNTLTCGLHVIF